jgi:hypothetical protein
MEPIIAIRYRSGNHGQMREVCVCIEEAMSIKIFIKYGFLNFEENVR